MGSNAIKYGHLYWEDKLFCEIAPDGKCFKVESEDAPNIAEGDDE